MSAAAHPPPARARATRRERDRSPSVVALRLSRSLPLLLLGLLVLGATAWVQQLGWSLTTFTNDELWGVIGGRLLADDLLGNLTSSHFDRGPERLVSLLQAAPDALLDDTADELRSIHVVLALAYFSAAIPVYAIARGLGLRGGQAALTAAVAIVTPWAVFGGSLLTVTVGLPANTLFAWAVWRGAVRPSPVGDLVIVLTAALNVLARTGHMPLTAVAVLAVVYAVWRRRPETERAPRSLLRLPVRVVRTHPLLFGVFALVAVAVAGIGTTTVVGSAYSMSGDITFPWQSIRDHTTAWFAQMTIASGFLPMIIGTAWSLRQLVRPTTPENGVFAVVAIGMFVVFSYATGNSFSVFEERYVAVLGALPAIAFGAALFRREAWPLGTLLVGLLAARAVATWGVYTNEFPSESYVGYQVAPGRLFFSEVVLARMGVTVPGPNTHIVTITLLLIVVVAVVAAVLLSAAPSRRLVALSRHSYLTAVAVAVAVAVIAFGAGSASWALDRYADGVRPETTFERLAWIDEATGSAPAFFWSYSPPSERADRLYLTLLTMHFNTKACCELWASKPGKPIEVQEPRDFLGPDGEIRGRPRYLIRFDGYHPVGFESTTVARNREFGPSEPMRVERLADPAKAAFEVRGAGADGTIRRDAAATLRTFSVARRPDRCVALELLPPVGSSRPAQLRISGGDRAVVRVIPAGNRRVIHVPVQGRASLRLLATGGDVRLGELALVRCG